MTPEWSCSPSLSPKCWSKPRKLLDLGASTFTLGRDGKGRQVEDNKLVIGSCHVLSQTVEPVMRREVEINDCETTRIR